MRNLLCLYAILAGQSFLEKSAEGFANGGISLAYRRQYESSLALGSGDIFDSFRKLWGNNDDGDDGKAGKDPTLDENLPAGTSLLASIPVKSIKPGGLRLFLMFYCMGMQNTPDRNTWRADQPSREEYVVEMLFHDATGMLTVELLEDEIRILRNGSMPSTAYLMQESVIVQGILDELRQCAFEESVPLEDRLLVPASTDALDAAAEELSFG